MKKFLYYLCFFLGQFSATHTTLLTNQTYQLKPEEQQKLNDLKQEIATKNLDKAELLIKDIRINIIEKYIKDFNKYKNDIINPISVTANLEATKTNYLDAIYVIHSQIRDIINDPYWAWRNQFDNFSKEFVPKLNTPDFTFDKLLIILRKTKMDETVNIYTKIILPLKEIEADLLLVLTDFISAYLQNVYYQKIGTNSTTTNSITTPLTTSIK